MEPRDQFECEFNITVMSALHIYIYHVAHHHDLNHIIISIVFKIKIFWSLTAYSPDPPSSESYTDIWLCTIIAPQWNLSSYFITLFFLY